MEMKLTNRFNEMNQEEMVNVDGGIVTEILLVVGLGALGMGTVAGTTALVLGVKKDLENCYDNGYNEVMNSAK